jgi:oligoendopeptidase F
MSFAGLRYYQHTTDPGAGKFMSDMQDKITTTPLRWSLRSGIQPLDDAPCGWAFGRQRRPYYKPIFDRMRAMKPHQLSDEMEKFLHDQSVVGATAWNKLFDKKNHRGAGTVDGKEMNIGAR